METERGVGLTPEKAKRSRLPVGAEVVPYWLVEAGYEPRELEGEELELLGRVKTERSREFLRWLPMLGTLNETCKRVGISQGSPKRWRERDPVFDELYTRLQQDIVAVLNDVAQQRAVEGFEDRMYNAGGELVGRRVRQDPSFFVKALAKMDPDWRKVDEGQQVSIRVVVAPE